MIMKSFWKLAKIRIKLYFREPPALFFTIFFAPMILIIFGSMYGNKPMEIFGGLGTVDISVPAYIAIIIVTVGFIQLPIQTATSREKGELRRLRVTPLHPALYMTVEILSYFILTCVGVALLILTGKLLYNAHFNGNILSTFIGFTLSTISFFSFGYLISALAPSGRAANIVATFFGFPMLFLSGSGMPLELMPENVRKISDFLPLKYVVTLMRGLWVGDSLGEHLTEILVLCILLIICAFAAVIFFKWE